MKFSALLLVAACTGGLSAADDITIADFEGADYGAWKTTGEAFGSGPAHGALDNQMPVDGFVGKGLVNSYNKGDGTTGTLTSPEFTIQRPFIAFRIGGGKDTERLCMKLLVDGNAVRVATGPNDKPGGSETLDRDAWDVKPYLGKTAVIEIVDLATGGWGHITVDQIVQTERKPAKTTNVTRDFVIDKRYLLLPIKNGAPMRVVTTLVDGKAEVRNDIALAEGAPDWWAFIDVGAWKGKTVTLRVDKLSEDSPALANIEQGDALKNAEQLYREPLRGQFHFSSRRGWLNDPNGMSYYNGEYHLFYQHNPYGTGWGNMHWGHAVSRDMLHWRELGDVLAPDAFGAMFSGSAVVDWNNTSGLGAAGKPPQVLVYTAAGADVQCLAASTDGRTYTKYSGNPVLKTITGGNRDPMVFWHAPTKKWVMALYVTEGPKHTVHLLTSPNLRDWTPASVIEGGGEPHPQFLFECPGFYPLPVDGDVHTTKWLLTAANCEYAIGSFDGTTFTPEATRLTGHRGAGFYAAQTFSDLPDGRRIMIGWLQTPSDGMPFSQSMTIPLQLGLRTTPAGPRLTFTPVKELESLRTSSEHYEKLTLQPDAANPLAGLSAELVEVRAEFTPSEASEVVFTVRGATIAYDAKKQELIVNNLRVPAPLRDGAQRLAIFCDRNALEVFASDGLAYVPMPFVPRADDLGLRVQVRGGSATLATVQVHHLASIWK